MRVNDSQAYRKMDVTRERISRILELREILLSLDLVSTLSMLLLSVLSWRVSRAWNDIVSTDSGGSTVLDLLESREVTEQTDWVKQPSQVACVLEDMKC